LHLWSKGFGDIADQRATAVAVDSSGNIFAAGSFQYAIDFGGGALMSVGMEDIFIAKLDEGGGHRWSRRFGSESPDIVHAIAVDSVGNVVMTGRFQGTIDFGGGPLVSEGDDDVFVAKLDAEGTHLWSRRYGNDKKQWGAAVAASGPEEVFLGGFFQEAVDFSGGALTTTQSLDTNLFIAKLRTP
jgi:hypothetical protein